MKNWSVSRQIWAIVGTFTLVMAVVGGVSTVAMSQVLKRLEPVPMLYLPALAQAQELERQMLNARIHLIYHMTLQREGSLQAGHERLERVGVAVVKMRELVGQDGNLKECAASLASFESDLAEYRTVVSRLTDMVAAGASGAEYDAAIAEFARLGNGLVTLAAKMAVKSSDRTRDAALSSSDTMRSAMSLVLGLCLVLGASGIAVAMWLAAGIKRLLKMSVTRLVEEAQLIAAAAVQMAATSRNLAEDAASQATAITETGAATTEMRQTAQLAADNSEHAVQAVRQARERVIEASGSLNRMVDAMKGIEESSNKIAGTLRVIDEIAFQTNILALNAAVEAARAGTAGAGFAVVADEVRALAQRCAAAARETAGLIETSLERVGEGTSQVSGVARSVQAITAETATIERFVAESRHSGIEQNHATEQVLEAMTSIRDIGERTSAAAQESAETSRSLQSQSEGLRGVVNDLQTLVGA